jgi:hypothetical protein
MSDKKKFCQITGLTYRVDVEWEVYNTDLSTLSDGQVGG